MIEAQEYEKRLRVVDGEIIRLERELEKEKEKRGEIISELQKRVADKQVMDDSEKIFFLMHPHNRKLFEKVKDLISGKSGELVLFVTKGQKRTMYGGPGSSLGLTAVEDWYLSELTSDAPVIDFETRDIRLPLHIPLIHSPDVSMKKIEVTDEVPNIQLLVSSRGSHLTWNRHERLQLIIGDDEVKRWFESHLEEELYNKMVEALNLEKQTRV